MEDLTPEGGSKEREVIPETIEGVDPGLLKKKAEAVLGRLGYRSGEQDGRLPPGYVVPPDAASGRARPRQSSDVPSESETPDALRMEVKKLEEKQRTTPLNFAECMVERNMALIASTSALIAAREAGVRKGATEFDETLMRALRDFDEETIYDFVVTVQKYAAYAETVPATIRDPRMRRWEQIALQNLERIEQTGVVYAGIRNMRLWQGKPADASARENARQHLPTCLKDIADLMGTREGASTVVKMKVWNPDQTAGAPRIIDKTIVIDEGLFTDPAREADRNYLEDACRQVMRTLAGGGVGYDLRKPDGVQKDVDEALQAKNLREGIAKLLATLIVGTAPKGYEAKQSQVRLPHAMYGKLLMGRVGQLQTEGVPKFDPEKGDRDPVELKKLGELRGGIRELAAEQEENVHYTMGLLLHQTMEMMSPSTKPKTYIRNQNAAAAAVSSGAIGHEPLAPETRQGIAVDQAGDNLEALGNVIDVSENGLGKQLVVVEATEKNIDTFMETKLAKYAELLSDWKVSIMKVTQWAPPNIALSQFFPGLRVTGETENLIIELRREMDQVRKRNEQLKSGLGAARLALQKAIGALQEERRGLLELQKQRKQLVEELSRASDDRQRQYIQDRLRANEEDVRAREGSIEKVNLDFCNALADVTKTNLSILEEAQVSDSYYTARSKVGLGAFIVSATLFIEWLSSYRGTYLLGKVVGMTTGASHVPFVNTIAYRTWQIGRRAGLGPVLLSDAKNLAGRTLRLYANYTLRGSQSVGTIELATGTATTGERLARAAELGITTAKYKKLGQAIEQVHNLKLTELRVAYQRVAAAGGNVAEAKRIFRAEVIPILKEKIDALKAAHGLSHADASLLVRRGVCGLSTDSMTLLAEGRPGWAIFSDTATALEEVAPVARTGATVGREVGAAGRTLGAAADAEPVVAAGARTGARAGEGVTEATKGTGRVLGRTVAGACIALEAAALGVDTYSYIKQKEFSQDAKQALLTQLERSGFTMKDGDATRYYLKNSDGTPNEKVYVDIGQLTGNLQMREMLAGGRIAADLIGLGGTVTALLASTGVGVPVAVISAGITLTLHVAISASDWGEARRTIGNLPPFIVAAMGTKSFTGESEEAFTRDYMSDIFIGADAFRSSIAEKAVLRGLWQAVNEPKIREYYPEAFQSMLVHFASPAETDRFFGREFQEIILPFVRTRALFASRSSSVSYDKIHEGKLNISREALNDILVKAAEYYAGHQREALYIRTRKLYEDLQAGKKLSAEQERMLSVGGGQSREAQITELGRLVQILGEERVFGRRLAEDWGELLKNQDPQVDHVYTRTELLSRSITPKLVAVGQNTISSLRDQITLTEGEQNQIEGVMRNRERDSHSLGLPPRIEDYHRRAVMRHFDLRLGTDGTPKMHGLPVAITPVSDFGMLSGNVLHSIYDETDLDFNIIADRNRDKSGMLRLWFQANRQIKDGYGIRENLRRVQNFSEQDMALIRGRDDLMKSLDGLDATRTLTNAIVNDLQDLAYIRMQAKQAYLEGKNELAGSGLPENLPVRIEELHARIQQNLPKFAQAYAALQPAIEEIRKEKKILAEDNAKRREAQKSEVQVEGETYLTKELGQRAEDTPYWEIGTGFSVNLNVMIAFQSGRWMVRWKKSDPWSLPDTVIPPSGWTPWSGKAETKTQEVLDKLAEINGKSSALEKPEGSDVDNPMQVFVNVRDKALYYDPKSLLGSDRNLYLRLPSADYEWVPVYANGQQYKETLGTDEFGRCTLPSPEGYREIICWQRGQEDQKVTIPLQSLSGLSADNLANK